MEYTFTSDNFEEEVLKSDVPVLVDMFATWCGPCKMMAPVVAQLAEEYEGTVKIGTDISQLQMEMDGNKIKVTMPHSKNITKRNKY